MKACALVCAAGLVTRAAAALTAQDVADVFGYTRIQDLIAALEECPNGATEVKNLESILTSNNLPNAACTTQLSLGTPLNSAVVGDCLDEHSSFTEKSDVQAFYECLTRTTTTSSITTTGSSITTTSAATTPPTASTASTPSTTTLPILDACAANPELCVEFVDTRISKEDCLAMIGDDKDAFNAAFLAFLSAELGSDLKPAGVDTRCASVHTKLKFDSAEAATDLRESAAEAGEFSFSYNNVTVGVTATPLDSTTIPAIGTTAFAIGTAASPHDDHDDSDNHNDDRRRLALDVDLACLSTSKVLVCDEGITQAYPAVGCTVCESASAVMTSVAAVVACVVAIVIN
jgi:hypothetical protein